MYKNTIIFFWKNALIIKLYSQVSDSGQPRCEEAEERDQAMQHHQKVKKIANKKPKLLQIALS